MRILAVAVPLPGHFDWGGYLDTTKVLRDAGHSVVWASERPALRLPHRAGLRIFPVPTTGWRLTLPPLPADLTPTELVKYRQQRALDVWLSVESVIAGVHALNEAVTQLEPDVILSEPYPLAATFVAEQRGLPLVICGVPAERIGGQRNAFSEMAWRRFQHIAEKVGSAGKYWSRGALPWPQSPLLHVSYFSRAWYGQMALGEQTFFAGGVPAVASGEAPSWLQQLPARRRLVLITLGSTFNRDIAFFQHSALAVEQVGGVPIVAAGRGWSEASWRQLAQCLPASAVLRPWVNFDHLFPRLWAIIHHGGVATTHRAIVHGLPQIVVPHAGDQRRQALRVQDHHIGFALTPRQATPENLAALLDQLLFQIRFRQQAQKLQNGFALLGGPSAAASAIERLFS